MKLTAPFTDTRGQVWPADTDFRVLKFYYSGDTRYPCWRIQIADMVRTVAYSKA